MSNDALALNKANWKLIYAAVEAIDDGADTLRAISERVGSHYATVGRHFKTVGLPPAQELADMDSHKRALLVKEARGTYDRAIAAEKKRAAELAERQRLDAIPTREEMREGYLRRKESGSRAVICRECGARGSANLRIVGKKGPVICGPCRTRLGMW